MTFKIPVRNAFSTNQVLHLETNTPNSPNSAPQSLTGERAQVAFGSKVTARLMKRRKQKTKYNYGRWSTCEAKQFLCGVHEHGFDHLGKMASKIETRWVSKGKSAMPFCSFCLNFWEIRSLRQIMSHAQKVFGRWLGGSLTCKKLFEKTDSCEFDKFRDMEKGLAIAYTIRELKNAPVYFV